MDVRRLKDKRFWARVRADARYDFIKDAIRSFYAEAFLPSLPSLCYSLRFAYYETGDRVSMEREYFRRRKQLSCAVILGLLEPETDRTREICDLVWAICDEYSWALPAHTDGSLQSDTHTVDLFVAETGFMLCELLQLIDLPTVVADRVRQCIDARVFAPFEAARFGWEDDDGNWNAVCAAGVGACYLYLRPDAFGAVQARLRATMQRFIDGYPEDGTCLEGFDYWHYGFGYYLWYADLLDSFGFAHDLLSGEKIKRIATYPQRSFLQGDAIVSFSDGSREGRVDCGVMHYLCRTIPDYPALGQSRTCVRVGNLGLVHWLRTFLFFDPEIKAAPTACGDRILPQAAQAVFNRGGYSFAVKAGHNAEQHNHNDVGSFIFCDKDGQALCDLGAGRYTKDYFGKGRYDILCNGSQGHSVPLFDGARQKAGERFCGTLTSRGNEITVEFAKSYGLESLTRATRTVRLGERGITLCDEFDYTGKSIRERFVSLRAPEVQGDRVLLGGTQITFYGDCKIEVDRQSMLPHESDLPPTAVYLIDAVLPDGAQKFKAEIKTVC